MTVIETNRLLLREFNTSDAEGFFNLNNDPEVLKYTGDQPFESLAGAEKFLSDYNQYSLYGYGRWTVLHKHTNEYLGWCGLKYSPGNDETDIGFRFLRSCWNKGYATEAAKATVDFGFKKLNLKLIVGRAMKDNIASVKVLEKAGLTYWKDFDFDGHNGVYFKIEK